MTSHLQTTLRPKGKSFPGPQPISIERRHLPTLFKGNYVVSPKADGTRCLLVVKDTASALINRAFEETEIKLRFNKQAKLGTILDVEVVEGKILVFDAYQVNGEMVAEKTLTERLEAAERVVKGTLKTAKDPIKLEMKPVFPRKEVDKAINGEFGYETDGLIFTPVDEPIRSGTHDTMFKWKPLTKNTIDFQFVPSVRLHDCNGTYEQGYDLYVQERGTLVLESRLPQHLAPAHLTPIMDLGTSQVVIMECEYVQGLKDVSNYWNPILHRKDKTFPNSVLTFQRTLVNIDEDIKWVEFKN